jgi:hypothetical protein
MNPKNTFLSALTISFLSIFSAFAEEAATPKSETDQKIEVLAKEVEQLKAGQEIFTPLGEGKYGLAPAASKVYGVKKGVSLGGYGEMVYRNTKDSPDEVDMLRAILYLGYKFNDHILFNSETEFEHGTTEGHGSVSVEFAYLDFLLRDEINFRAGLILSPMGFLNELHEPPVYLGVNRPEVERRIIPSTWREMGGGIFGTSHDFTYRAYALNSFRSVGDPAGEPAGFSSEGLRDGRQNGSEALGDDFAFVGRVDYEGVKGLLAGTSLFIGNTGQGLTTPTGDSVTGTTSIFEGHVDYRFRGAEFRALMAHAFVDADRINVAQGFTGADSVGSRLAGYYLQAGYNVLQQLETEQQLIPYFRYEWLDTQSRTPAGFASDPANEQKIYVFGASYKPIVNLALKTDYQQNANDAGATAHAWNVSLGYLF